MFSGFAFSQNSGSIVLNTGQKLQMDNHVKAIINQEAGGQTIEINADITTMNTMDVKEKKDNNYNLTNTVNNLKADMSFMGQNMNFDSDKKEDMNGEMGQSMKDVFNIPRPVTIDNTAKMLTVSKVDEKKKEVNTASPMTGMMDKFVGNIQEANYGVAMAFQVIPKTAGVGYTWSDSTNKDGTISKNNYIIKEIKGNEANVDITGVTKSQNKTEAQGMEVTSTSAGTVKGNALVDLMTGIVKQRTTTLDLSGTVEAMGQEMPMTSKITTVTSVKEIKK